MVYSNARLDDKQADFPPPPMWLTWLADNWYGSSDKKGTVRHHDSLQTARKYIGRGGYGNFYADWAIYKWDGNKYVKVYSGKKDETKTGHRLFKQKIKNLDPTPEREADEDELQAAIQSILNGTS